MKKVLVIATSGLGDTLGTAPLVSALARAGLAVDLLTTWPGAAPLFPDPPRRTVTLPRDWMKGLGSVASAIARATVRIRAGGPYDAAIVSFPSGHRATALLAVLSGAGERVGYPYPEGSARRSRWGLTIAAESGSAHLADRNLDLARALGISVPPDASRFRPPPPAPRPPSSSPVAFHIGASPREPFKRWPIAHFERLGRLCLDVDIPVLLVGGDAERDESEALAARLSPPRDCGTFREGESETLAESVAGASLKETAARLARCRALVAGDSGVAHLAALLGLPIVSLFGPTSEARYGPRGERVRLLTRPLPCRPCHVAPTAAPFRCAYERPMACLEEIMPERVFLELRDLLGTSR